MSAPLALKCPSCASSLRAEEFDAAQGIVKCSYCHALMTLPGRASDFGGLKARLQMPLPSGVRVKQTMGGIEIQRRWFSPTAIFLIFFCIVWDSFLVFWFGTAFTTGAPLAMSLFPIVHLVVGVGVTYFTVATLFNSTRVMVDRGEVKVSHGPIPWLGNQSVHAGRMNQIYCKKITTRGKHGPRHSYEVWMALHNGVSKKLVSAGLGVEQAIFIEQELERALGIKDQPIAGEMARS